MRKTLLTLVTAMLVGGSAGVAGAHPVDPGDRAFVVVVQPGETVCVLLIEPTNHDQHGNVYGSFACVTETTVLWPGSH